MNVIELGYDVDKLSTQQKTVVQYLTDVLNLADKLDGKKIFGGVEGSADLKKAFEEQAAQIKALQDANVKYVKTIMDLESAQKAATKSQQDGTKATAAAVQEIIDNANAAKNASNAYSSYTNAQKENVKVILLQENALKAVKEASKALDIEIRQEGADVIALTQNKVDLKDQELQLSAALRESRRLFNLQTKEISEQEGSVNQLQAQYDQLFAIFRGATPEFAAELAPQLEQISQELNKARISAGNFNNNVGNYAGALKSSFSLLQIELQKVNQQLAVSKETDPGFKKLQADALLLEKVLETVDKQFSNSKTEMRAFTEASKQLGQQFGTNNELFQSFVQEIGGQKDKLDDIQKTINFNSSDTKYLDGIVAGVSGIVGAYGAWQSATVLLGNDNEELNKSMQKLQAVLTLVQSLQAVLNAVQTESGAIQTALAAKTALVNAAKQVEAFLFTETTAAVVANTVATEANAGAQVTLAEGEAAASAGAVGLRTAIISTGIGALVLALVYGITKLVGAISDWVGADERAVKIQTELVKAMNDVADAQIELTKQVQDGVQLRIAAMEREAEVIKARGVSDARSIAIDKQVAETKLATAKSIIYSNNITEESRARADKALQESLKNVELYEGIKASIIRSAEAKNKTADEDDIKRVDQKIEKAKLETTGFQKEYDKQSEALKNKNDFQKNLDVLKAADDKRSADDARKIALETARIQSEAVIFKNSLILNSEKSTQGQRITALQNTLAEEKKIAAAENTNVQNDPTASGADKLIAKKKYNAEVKKLNVEEKEAERKINEDYDKRNLDASHQSDDILIQQKIKINDDITQDLQFSLSERLDALKGSTEASQQLIESDYEYQKKILDSKDSTQREYQLLNIQRNQKEVELAAATQEKLVTILKAQFDKGQQLRQDELDSIKAAYSSVDLATTQHYSNDIIALNKSFEDGKISYEKYNRDRAKLDEKFGRDSLKNQVDNLQKQIAAYSDVYEQEEIVNEEIAAARIERDNATTDAERLAADAKIKEGEEELDVVRKNIETQKELEKGLADTKIKLSDEEIAKRKEAKAKILESTKQLITESVALFQQLVDGGYQKELNAIDALQAKQDEYYATQIKNIQDSTLSEQDKAAKITVLTAEQKAADLESERRKKEIQNRQAKADRAFAVASIVQNTASAIVAALKLPFPFNLVEAAIVGGIGAVQLASVLAKPIPTYAKGLDSAKQDHYGIHGEAGPELITKPGQSPYISNKATFDFIPKGTSIKPITGDVIDEVMNYAMIGSMAHSISNMQKVERIGNQEARSLMLEQTSMLLRGLKDNKPNVVVKNNIHSHGDWPAYIKSKTNWN